MDDLTFRQLKESKYYHPILTEVMFDYDMMLEMVFHSMTIMKKGYDTVWDSNMLYFILSYFKEGVNFIESLIREKGIKVRIIIQTTRHNVEYIKSMKYFDVRCLDDIKGNFGIFDNRAYMVYIFHRDSDKPDQTLWSNSKVLVDKQQALFEKLWEMATPFAVRKKELEYENILDTQRTITGYQNIQREIDSLILICKRELTIFSPNRILYSLLNKNNYMNHFQSLLERGISIKILTDNVDQYLINQVTKFNHSNQTDLIQLGYTNKLGDFNEMTMIIDNKHLLHIRYGQGNILVATFSNEEHNILVQELMFEKHWNEVKSLEVANNN